MAPHPQHSLPWANSFYTSSIMDQVRPLFVSLNSKLPILNVEAEIRGVVVSPCWRHREMQLHCTRHCNQAKGNHIKISTQMVNSHEKRKALQGNKYSGDTCRVIYFGKCFQPNETGYSWTFSLCNNNFNSNDANMY